MAVVLTKIGKTPGQTQFGLDTFTEHHKADATADIVLTDASVPQKGDAHADYPFMFLTDRYCSETGEKASSLDLVYTGCLKDDGGGNPILPPRKHDTETAVQSASSSRSYTGSTLTSPTTLQFYAPTSVLSYMSFGAPGTVFADDPTDDPGIITLTFNDFTFSVDSFNIQALVNAFFSIQIVESHSSTELVAGQYWQNTSKKLKHYTAFILSLPPGPYAIIADGGHDYVGGDTLTVTLGGESATILVTSTWVGGIITGINQTANTFTAAHTLLAATGGTGTGAKFNIIIIA